MRNSSFVLALRYCRSLKLVFTSFCFQTVPKPELTSAARIMDQNSQKWSQKCYQSLPFAVKVSARRSFEQFHNLNKWQGSFPHHSTPPCKLYKWKGFFWLRVETRLLIALFFLPFGTPDSDSKFWRHQVFIRNHWASAGKTKGNRLWKRKRNVYFHHYSFQICITGQAWGQHDWIYGQIPFLHFSRLSRSPLFFPGWLCHETSSLAARPRALNHWSSLCSLLRTDEW